MVDWKYTIAKHPEGLAPAALGLVAGSFSAGPVVSLAVSRFPRGHPFLLYALYKLTYSWGAAGFHHDTFATQMVLDWQNFGHRHVLWLDNVSAVPSSGYYSIYIYRTEVLFGVKEHGPFAVRDFSLDKLANSYILDKAASSKRVKHSAWVPFAVGLLLCIVLKNGPIMVRMLMTRSSCTLAKSRNRFKHEPCAAHPVT